MGWYTEGEEEVVIASIVLTALSVLVVAARLYCRRKQNQHLRVSDFFMVLALICECVIEGLHINSFTHETRPITDPEIARRLTICALVAMFNWVALSMIRISILILFSEIFFYWRDRVAIWFGVAICALCDLVFIPTILGACVPSAGKTVMQQLRICHKVQLPLSFTGTAIGVVLNTYILVLPIRTIMGLHMPPRKKVLVAINFSIGGVALVASLARLGIKIHVFRNGLTLTSLMKLAVWGSIEGNCGIIAGSVICLKMFFGRLYERRRKGSGVSDMGDAMGGKQAERRRGTVGTVADSEGTVREGGGMTPGMVEAGLEPVGIGVEGGGRREDLKFIQVRRGAEEGWLDLEH